MCVVHFNVTTDIQLLLLWSFEIKGLLRASPVNVTSQVTFPFLLPHHCSLRAAHCSRC